jgi:hypothetical protein
MSTNLGAASNVLQSKAVTQFGERATSSRRGVTVRHTSIGSSALGTGAGVVVVSTAQSTRGQGRSRSESATTLMRKSISN